VWNKVAGELGAWYYGTDVPSGPPATFFPSPQMRWIAKGSSFYMGAPTGSASTTWTMPYDGYVLNWGVPQSFQLLLQYSSTTHCNSLAQLPQDRPSGWDFHVSPDGMACAWPTPNDPYEQTTGHWEMFSRPARVMVRDTLPAGATLSGTWNPYARPSRAAVVTNIHTALQAYPKAGQWFEHELDPRCHPDPTSATVVVPEILAGESATDYTTCLQTLGLQPSTQTLTETDVETVDDGAVFTDPEEGTTVTPNATVTVAKNPHTPTGTKPDERCRPAGAGAAGDPGPPTIGGPNPEWNQTVATYPGIDPHTTPPNPYTVELNWGRTDWGYRHIKIRRGYGAQDEADTRDALTDPFPVKRYSAPEQWLFKKLYSVPDGAGGTISCARVVAVEYDVHPTIGKAKGIVTSYYGQVAP
jgi:PASTA domain